MMRVVFLDFDGPIIPMQSHKPYRPILRKAWPPCVDALNRILLETGAKIVVSSSWRADGLNRMRALAKAWGVNGRPIAITPDLTVSVGLLYSGATRGSEISAWLKDHPDVESFVILDDDDDMDDLKDFLVQTPFEVGLTQEDASRAIKILNAGDKTP